MAKPTSPSSALKQDWRARPPQAQGASGSRYLRRTFFSLLLAGLVAWLVWLILSTLYSSPNAVVVCIPIRAQDMTMAPAPFAARNAEELETRLGGQGVKVEVWRDLQRSDSLATLSNRLQPIASNSRMALVLYISAQGVSQNGNAYLLCSDYQPRVNPEGRYEFGKLLEQIRVCRAKPKLLLLDISTIAVDPRLGFVVNEFPRLVEAKVRETADPDLYVLMSQGLLEQSHVSYAGRRSVFNYYVTEGLHGAANRTDPNDYVVDLAELFAFVRNGVAARVAQQTGERETQVPVLLRGGEGICRTVPEGLALVKVPPESREEAPAGEAEKKDAAKQGPPPGSASDAEPAAKPTPAAADPGAAKGGKKPAAKDAVPPKGAKAKPDAAPEKAAAPEKVQAAAPTLPAAPPEKKTAASPAAASPASAPDSVPVLLTKAWRQRDRRARAGADGWSPVDYAPHLWREYNELLLGFELRYRYKVALEGERLKLLRDLAEGNPATPLLAQLENARERFSNDSSTLQKFARARSEELGDIGDAIKLRDDLMFAAPYYVRWHARAATASSAAVPLYESIRKLLDDEHLPKLVRLLNWWERPSAADTPEYKDHLEQLRKTAQELKDLRTDLEDGANGLHRAAENLLKSGPKRAADMRAIEDLLSIPLFPAELRARLIERLDQLDRNWPLEIATAREPARPPAETVRTLGIWRRYVEQWRLEAALAKLADPGLQLPDEPAAAPAPNPTKSDNDVWEDYYRKLGDTLGAFYQAMPERIGRGYNSPKDADVQEAANQLRMVDARDVIGEWTQQVAGIALRGPELPPELRVKLDAAVEKKADSRKVQLELPLPDVVEVVVDRVINLATGARVRASRISRPQRGAGEEAADVPCDAFPNRTTEYVVSLVNHSGKAKKVRVELWAPPPGTGSSPARLEGPLDPWGKALPGYGKLASADDLDLDPAGKPLAIPFVPTKPEPKKDTAEEAKKAAEKAGKKARLPPEAPSVSRGLACVVYEMAGKESKPNPQVHWLRFRPVAPREYLQRPEVKYDQRRVSIQVRPLDVDLIPRLSEETPIRIDWSPDAAIDPNSQMLTHAEITAPNQVGELFADVPPKPGKETLVRLSVDGYPRAFVYRVPLDRPSLRADELRDQHDVRITAPKPNEAFRAPLKELPVEFQVDAPADAFQNRGKDKPRDFIEVGMDVLGPGGFPIQDRVRFYSDRQFEARVKEIGAGGLLKVDAKVHDFRIALKPGAVENARAEIRVTMKLFSGEALAGGRDVPARVPVIFDAAPPAVRLIEAPRARVPRGNDATIILEAKDPDPGSGVAKIECGLHQGDSAELEEKDKPVVVFSPSSQEPIRITLPTKDLKPGKYALLARVTDRVGWKTSQRLGDVEIVEPPPPKPPESKKMPALSSIAGRAILGSPDANITWIGLKITLKELGRTVTADSDGHFNFPDVPPGQYTLEGHGIGANKIVKGTTRVTVTEKPAKIDLPME